MSMIHPFMPDLSGKSLDDIVKEMNQLHVKMRGVRNQSLLAQMDMVMTGYREEYQKRMSQEMDRSKNKQKKDNNDG